MAQKKVLITGSKGLIGKILAESLSDSFDIYGLDITGQPGKKFFKADISDRKSLDKCLKKISPVDCLIHLAADSRVNAPWPSVLKNNILGTINIYQGAKKYRIRKVIFASSNHVTGGYEGIPPNLHKQNNPRLISTRDLIKPDSNYGTSKATCEAIARQYWELHQINSICLRIGSVLSNNDPAQSPRTMKTWLSHRDLVQLVRKSIHASIRFGIYYGVSNNNGRFWDISNAEKEIGYHSKDDASKFK